MSKSAQWPAGSVRWRPAGPGKRVARVSVGQARRPSVEPCALCFRSARIGTHRANGGGFEMSQAMDTYLSAESGFMALLAKAQTAPPEVLKAIGPALEDAARSVIWAYGQVVEAMEVAQ